MTKLVLLKSSLYTSMLLRVPLNTLQHSCTHRAAPSVAYSQGSSRAITSSAASFFAFSFAADESSSSSTSSETSSALSYTGCSCEPSGPAQPCEPWAKYG